MDQTTAIHLQHAINALGRALDLERMAHQQSLVRESLALERATLAEAKLAAACHKVGLQEAE